MITKLTATGFIREQIEHTRQFFSGFVEARPQPEPEEQVTWERNPPRCRDCNAPMTRCIFDTPDYRAGQYFCSPCHQLRVQARIFRDKTRTTQALFGPGQLMQMTRAGMQNNAYHDIISSMNTQKNLQESGEMQVPLQLKHGTGPLPARDIERANTARADLFADVPERTVEDDDDPTTQHPTVRASIHADALLRALAAGRVSTRETGENEVV